MSAPTFVQQSSSGEVNGGVTLGPHASAAVDDVQLLAVATHASVGVATPSGWTVLGQWTTAHARLTMWWRRVTSGNIAANVVVPWGDNGRVVMRTYRGVGTTGSIVGVWTGAGQTNPARAVPADALLVRVGDAAQQNAGGSAHTATADSALLNASSPISFSWYSGLVIGDDPTTPGNTAPTRTYSVSGSTVYPQWADVMLYAAQPVPEKPANLVLTPTTTTVVATWDTAQPPGTTYEYRLDGGTPVALSATTVTLTGLAVGAPHLFEVRSVNSTGNSPWTAQSFTTTFVRYYADDYATTPLSRVTLNGGSWSWDSTNQRLVQTDTASLSRFALVTDMARETSVDYEFDYTIVSDPAARKHAGAFIQADVDGSTLTGFRITHLDNSFVLSRYNNNVETSLTPTVVNNPTINVGTTYRWRVKHDFTTDTGSLAVDGVTVLTWTDTAFSNGRPGFHTYGASLAFDNLAANTPTAAPPYEPVNLSAVVRSASAVVSWSATYAAVSYEYRVDAGTPVAVPHGGKGYAPLTATVAGLATNVAANVQVRAVNASGAGPWSAALSVTPLAPQYAETFTTDPFAAPARVTVLADPSGDTGQWTWENGRLHQNSTSNNSKFACVTSMPRMFEVDFEFDYMFSYDPGTRLHNGAFIQTVDGALTGLRVTHIDNSYIVDAYTNGSASAVTVTPVTNTVPIPGRWYRWRVRHDFGTGAGSLTVDGVTAITWTTTAFLNGAGRPGFHTYGSVYDVDNVVFGPVSTTIAPQSAPTGLVAQPGPALIGYAFNAHHEATSYDYRLNGGTPVNVPRHHGKITGLVDGTSYDVQVRAVNASGAGPWSATVTVTPNTTPYEAVVLTKSPVLLARLDEAAGADYLIDVGSNGVDWRNNYPASLGKTPVTTEANRGAASSPGSSRFPMVLATLPVPTSLTTQPETVEEWISLPPGNLNGYFFTLGQAGGWAVGIGNGSTMDTAGRTLMMVQENVAWKTTTYTFPDDGVSTVRYLITVTRDTGDAWSVYVNGVLVSTQTWTPVAYSALQHSIGILGPASMLSTRTIATTVKADNFAAYAAVLSAASIRENYLAGVEQAATPDAVTNLAAMPLDSAALVSWTAPNPPSVNRWQYRINGGAAVATTSARFVITGLTNGADTLIEVRGVTTLGGSGPWTSVHVTPRVTYLWDDFERANATPAAGALGTPVQGSAWSALSGAIGISGGRAYVTVSQENIYSVPAASDVDVSFLRADAVANGGIVFRAKDVNNLWLFNGHLYRRVAGTYVQVFTGGLGGTQAVAAPNDVWRVLTKDKRIRVYINGALVLNVEDTYYDATAVGVGMRLVSPGNLVESIVAYATFAADFPERTGATETLADVLSPATRQYTQTHVYKGRDTKTADSGTVA